MLMCWIAGYAALPDRPETAQRMLKTMNGAGEIRRTNGAVLLQTGKAPMCCGGEGERVCIAFDGRLTERRQLWQSLRRTGEPENNPPDGELFLRAFLKWGTAAPEKINGVFAAIIWEQAGERLYLFRDRLGIKPLFYAVHNGGILAATALGTILAHPSMKAELDQEGAAQLVLLGPGRSPGSGIFRGIQALEPGFWGVFQKGNLRLRRYWQLKDRPHLQTLDETAEQIRTMVVDAIRQQDGPQTGVFLSGGLDSSLIAAVCGENRNGEKLNTFSVDYLHQEQYFSPDSFQPDQDRYYIEKMLQVLPACHHPVILSPRQLLENLEAAACARDLPGMGDVDASLLLLCRQTRQTVPAVLSGEGADEIFGGYPWFRQAQQVEDFPWAGNTDSRLALLHPDFHREALKDYARQQCAAAVGACDLLPDQSQEEKNRKILMNLNLRWFMQTLAERNDRMSRAADLEVRVPFCDHRIAAYLYGIPWEMKQFRGREKGLLRYAMRGLLPDEVLWRKKSPYPKTFDPGYEALVLEQMNRLMENREARLFSLIDRQALGRWLEAEERLPWYGQLMRRPQTAAWLLQTEFWLEHYQVEIVS